MCKEGGSGEGSEDIGGEGGREGGRGVKTLEGEGGRREREGGV